MALQRSSIARVLRSHPQFRTTRSLFYRQFHASNRLDIVKPFLLADVGEGIVECQLIQWFVQPGARVEQFDKICEVQSDKASVEITSPFDGVIKKLHYEPDDMAITGKPLVDIDIEGEIDEADAKQLGGGGEGVETGQIEKQPLSEKETQTQGREAEEQTVASSTAEAEAPSPPPPSSTPAPSSQPSPQPSGRPPPKGDVGSLATPAVRRLTREHNVNITDISGTGKDGRVLKEDVERHVSGQGQGQQQPQSIPTPAPTPTTSREDRKVPLTPVQNQMFKTMTKSLNIPHFLYTTSADMEAMSDLRSELNAKAQSPEQKITPLAFIIKALSLSLQYHPLLNSSLDTKDPKKPELTHKGSHNFGIGIDAPAGLVVPVLKNVQDLSVIEIASTLRQLGEKARTNKLAPGDFSGATFTVSNIGSVGGGVVAPVITEPQVAILGVGRSKKVPAFNELDEIVKKEELTLSWSADHRVVDGAECARCAERVRGYLENPGTMLAALR